MIGRPMFVAFKGKEFTFLGPVLGFLAALLWPKAFGVLSARTP